MSLKEVDVPMSLKQNEFVESLNQAYEPGEVLKSPKCDWKHIEDS